ncbi:MAG TPA: hypothetical protein PK678_14140, partial [Ferruginibacter sp.]|nr:hypothetical protein [Ferruginibacter sp.]
VYIIAFLVNIIDHAAKLGKMLFFATGLSPFQGEKIPPDDPVPRRRSGQAALASASFPLRRRSVQKIVTFEYTMTPDYPHKHFADKRNDYSLLMLTLAMDSAD